MAARRALALVLCLFALCLSAPAGAARAQPTPAARGPAAAQAVAPDVDVDLQRRLKDVDVVEVDGALYVREAGDGPARLVPAAEWVRALHDAQDAQRRAGFLYVLFNITKPWGFAWVAIGFLGQLLFTFRMLLQWWTSERAKRSVIPVAFWWGSLFGGLMLFVYFCWRKDIVGILGQSTGVFVYARNLVLIHRRAAAQSAARARPATST